MILMTMIARVGDGLPLAASIQEDDQHGRGVLEYQNKAKMLFRKLTPQSQPKLSLDTGAYVFHYIILSDVCYLVLCERDFPSRLAFSFLQEIADEFQSQYNRRISSATRPYSFIEFDTFIQKTKKNYSDSRARRNLNTLNSELQDVQRIMMENIDDVLQRGAAISELEGKAQGLSVLSQKYKKDARYLNLSSIYSKLAAGGILLFVFFLYFWVF